MIIISIIIITILKPALQMGFIFYKRKCYFRFCKTRKRELTANLKSNLCKN